MRKRETMNNTNYAIFIDLENAGGKVSTLSTIIEKVKIRGNILVGRAYGYTDSYSPLKELLLSNTFQVVPSIKFGHMQKNNLDIQLVIDALEMAFQNELIDCFCIVSGDSDYTPLVGKLKSMGKFVLGISRSEVASKVFINACNEFIFLENMADKETKRKEKRSCDNGDLAELNSIVSDVLEELDGDFMYASELKSTVMRLRPDFNERSYGAPSFGRLLTILERRFHTISIENDHFAVKVRLADAPAQKKTEGRLTRENWMEIATNQLIKLKEEDFERVNPSVIKQALTESYPDFDERSLGFKKFSDLLKALERQQVIAIETDDQHSMLVHIL